MIYVVFFFGQLLLLRDYVHGPNYMATCGVALETWIQAQTVAIFYIIDTCLFRIYHAPNTVKNTGHAGLV